MCVKSNGNGKLKWDAAETIKLGLTLLTIIVTVIITYYKMVGSLERAITVNATHIERLQCDVSRNELGIRENRVTLNHYISGSKP